MAKTEFPVALQHPKTKGETTAATPTSLRVLEARGWKPKPKSEQPTNTGG